MTWLFGVWHRFFARSLNSRNFWCYIHPYPTSENTDICTDYSLTQKASPNAVIIWCLAEVMCTFLTNRNFWCYIYHHCSSENTDILTDLSLRQKASSYEVIIWCLAEVICTFLNNWNFSYYNYYHFSSKKKRHLQRQFTYAKTFPEWRDYLVFGTGSSYVLK